MVCGARRFFLKNWGFGPGRRADRWRIRGSFVFGGDFLAIGRLGIGRLGIGGLAGWDRFQRSSEFVGEPDGEGEVDEIREERVE